MIEIVFCADKNYIGPLAVTLASVVLSNSNEFINFYIITADMTDIELNILLDIVKKNGDLSKQHIFMHSIDANVFYNLPTMGHISIATYFRLMIADILPKTVKKVLYLDCDILCIDKLKKFFNRDISNFAVAACRDAYNDDVTTYNRLEYPMDYGYFNAGVLLINLEYWRKKKIGNKAIKFAAENPEICIFSDQDVLNKVIDGNVLWVPFKYDCIMSYLYCKDFSELRISIKYKKEIIQAIKKPCIIHFTGGCKPWFIDYNLCFKSYYNELYKKIFGHPIKRKYSKHGIILLKWKIKKILYKLGIKKYGFYGIDTTYSDLENTLIKKYIKS